MASLDNLLRKMEEWDRISHSIADLNQSRARAESETVRSIEHILAAIDECKQKLVNGTSEGGGKSSELLARLLEASEEVDLVSKNRDDMVKTSLSRLKQAVDTALHVEDQEEYNNNVEAEEEESESNEDEDSRDKAKEGPTYLGMTAATKDESNMIDRALVWHYLHEGYLDTARTFSKETGLNCLPEVDVVRVKAGLEAADAMLKRKDLSPAISWVEEYSSTTSSNLLFDLHRLRFLQLATSQTEAIGYAQRNFARFATSRSQEIQTLLGGLLFSSQPGSHSASLQASQSAATDDRAWEQTRLCLLNEVRRTYASISVLVSTGMQTLPELKRYQKLVTRGNRITTKTWKESMELPVQVSAPTHFHSEFLCPVSQEQADFVRNPPMLLVCGHVVAKNSIARIAKGRHRFKCPTCPTEQAVDAPTPVQF